MERIDIGNTLAFANGHVSQTAALQKHVAEIYATPKRILELAERPRTNSMKPDIIQGGRAWRCLSRPKN
jgi:hypothetical protein